MIEGTRLTEIIIIITFFFLLGAAILMLIGFYICDSQTCKAFLTANDKATPESKQYILALLAEMYNDGIWPIPYIGATIATGLSLFFLGFPVNVVTFAIMFFVIFVTIYFMFTFFGHHYVKPITRYVSDYVDDNCPNPTTSISNDNLNSQIKFDNYFEPFIDENSNFINNEISGITFATPVNIF